MPAPRTAGWSSGCPGALATHLVDPNAGEQARRRIRRREVLVGAEHCGGELLEQFGCAAFGDAGGARDREVGRLPARRRFDDGHRYARVAPNVTSLAVF